MTDDVATASKRPAMRNGIQQRGDTWSFVLRVPVPGGGTKPRWWGGFPTMGAAKKAKTTMAKTIDAGEYVEKSSQTVEHYLTGWLTHHQVKPATKSTYRTLVARCVVPRIGKVKLQALKAPALTRLYADLLTGGGQDGKPLSVSTVRQVSRIMHRALRDAVDDDLVAVNVAERARPPKPAEVEHAEVWTPDQVHAFLAAASDHRLFAYFRLALFSGCRRGELLALTWADIDLIAGRVNVAKSVGVIDRKRITGSTKSGKPRVVGIDVETARILTEHRHRQQIELDREPGPTDLAFCQKHGAPLSPTTVTQMMPDLCEIAGVPRIRLHDLRHAHASMLLSHGAAVHEVASRLGHADGSVTMSVYAHVLQGRDQALATTFAASLGAPVSKIVSKSEPALRAV